MAEYNKQRYYWIKLTDKFMTSDTVDFLMGQKDGANYVILYQMLCLKTVNNNGQLARTLGEIIVPYDEEKIQRDTKWFSIDTIRVAMNLYRKLGLIYEQEDGILRISNFENMIGSQTISAFKKQIQLENKGGKKVEKIPPYIDIYKDKEIEIEKEYLVSKQVSNLKKELTNIHACESYDEVLEGFGVFGEYRNAVFRFIAHLKVSFGIVMLNDRLENLIIKLDRSYDEDSYKVNVIDDAIVKGFKKLECE
jgi:predicted phage replisome organizer